MRLFNENTRWVFLLPCSKDPEDRHIHDIAFGVYSLESIGISSSNIRIYIDGAVRDWIYSQIHIDTNNTYTIGEISDFFTDCLNNNHDNMILFITGHGSINGLPGCPPIKPYHLIKKIKGYKRLKRCIVYLGQCYAGIFNYLNVTEKTNKISDIIGPEIILIGATQLYPSISILTTETLANGDRAWQANLFLLNTFKWISKPIDIDGDGLYTVMDCYKFAGSKSNDSNILLKIDEYLRPLQLKIEIDEIQQKLQQHPNNKTDEVVLQSLQQDYKASLLIHLNQQECWILNSMSAQKIEF